MTTLEKPLSQGKLVDWDRGLISRDVFVNRDLYEQELEQIFARVWLLIGHESQVQKPGDYFLSRMGEESVILTRDRAGKLHVFLNSCAHRGMKPSSPAPTTAGAMAWTVRWLGCPASNSSTTRDWIRQSGGSQK